MGSEVPTGALISGPFTAAASIYPTDGQHTRAQRNGLPEHMRRYQKGSAADGKSRGRYDQHR